MNSKNAYVGGYPLRKKKKMRMVNCPKKIRVRIKNADNTNSIASIKS